MIYLFQKSNKNWGSLAFVFIRCVENWSDFEKLVDVIQHCPQGSLG